MRFLGKQLTTQKDKNRSSKKALENSKAQYGENDDKNKKMADNIKQSQTDLNKRRMNLKTDQRNTEFKHWFRQQERTVRQQI